MGKKKYRAHKTGANTQSAAGMQAATFTPPIQNGGGRSVSFAKQYEAHNYVPPLHERERDQLTGGDLRAVWAKADRLFTDCPYAYGPITSVADYLGPIKPKANTDDTAWNELVDAWFSENYWDLGLWDASRKFSTAHAQRWLNIYADLHGDVLAVYTTDDEGVPCIRMIPATGVDSPAGFFGPGSPWQDGVKIGQHHRAEAFHVLAAESAPRYLSYDGRRGYVVDAADAMLLGNFKVGAPRGFSRLIPTGGTIVHMQMYDNSTHDLLNLASKIGMSLETQAGQPALGTRPISGTLDAFHGKVAATPEGSEASITRYQEQFLSDGPAVMSLPPGSKLNLDNLDRDLPDLSTLRGGDYERIAMTYGLPVQMLFCIMSGMFNVTGPNVRLALGRAKTWRDQELVKREPLVKRQYVRVIEWAIRTKQIPKPKRDLRWWRCKMQWAKNYTIDEARDVKSDMMRLQMGVTTMQELAEEYGSNAVSNILQQVELMDIAWQELQKRKLPFTLLPMFSTVKLPADAGKEEEEDSKKPDQNDADKPS